MQHHHLFTPLNSTTEGIETIKTPILLCIQTYIRASPIHKHTTNRNPITDIKEVEGNVHVEDNPFKPISILYAPKATSIPISYNPRTSSKITLKSKSHKS